MDTTLRGFYAIALTPFDGTGNLLWDDLEREFDWIARAGAHGIVWPVNNSEQRVLAFPERVRGLELLAQTIDGRIPTVGGVADTSKAGAVALSEAFECGVNDLPLSMVLSWYEQKAVVILLTLLHLGIRNIRLGPSLPAFISPNVLNVLVENFNIMPIQTAEADLKAILG